jgi:anti-sigma factor RsiW
MTCQQTQDLLHGYIDGELDVLTNVELERHFDQCETCAVARQKQLELRSFIKDHAPCFQAPDLLTKRLQKDFGNAKQPEPKQVAASLRWFAIAASVAILALSGLLIWMILSNRSPSDANDLLAQEVVASHVRSLMGSHLTDVPSSDQHTVKPWFDGKLDFAPPVKDLSTQDFPLVGGRLDYIGSRAVAALVYQRRKHYINLFIWPSGGASDQSEQELARQGYNVIHWIHSGTNYWAVSDVNSTDLREFVRLVKE